MALNHTISGVDGAVSVDCTFEPFVSFADLLNAYIKFTSEYLKGNLEFVSIRDHIDTGNGQSFSLGDCIVMLVCTIFFGAVKNAHDSSFDGVRVVIKKVTLRI